MGSETPTASPSLRSSVACGTTPAGGKDLVDLWPEKFSEEQRAECASLGSFQKDLESGLWFGTGLEEKRERNDLRSEEQSKVPRRQCKQM